MKSWLQLFRAPNLFTVPGDPLAGCLLASAAAKNFQPAIIAVITASLLLYGFGLLLNDLMDLPEDRAERPSRPLPSGAITPRAAKITALILAVVSVSICICIGGKTAAFGCILIFAITFYNCGVKKIPVVGAINMGACRGLNVLLGASLAPSFTTGVIAASSVIAIYIAAVTLLARHETENPAIPPLIGRLIRALILIQAGLCAASGGWPGWSCAAILALALWPLSRIVGKRFYAS